MIELEPPDVMALLIGRRVLNLSALCPVMGWKSPRGALPYLHPIGDDHEQVATVALVDFIRWCSGVRDGDGFEAARLRGLAHRLGITHRTLSETTHAVVPRTRKGI